MIHHDIKFAFKEKIKIGKGFFRGSQGKVIDIKYPTWYRKCYMYKIDMDNHSYIWMDEDYLEHL